MSVGNLLREDIPSYGQAQRQAPHEVPVYPWLWIVMHIVP